MLAPVVDFFRELSEVERLLSDDYKEARRIVFYAESPIYFRYFEDYIRYILTHSNFEICYIASSAQDPIFNSQEKRIKPFYINNLLNPTLLCWVCLVVVLTVPDLGRGAVKPAPNVGNHIYAFHGLSSCHHYYRLGAFDNYDSVLCINETQIEELRKTEAIYQSRAKNLILTGYPRIETIYREYQDYRNARVLSEKQEDLQGSSPTRQRICLIAPSWFTDNSCSLMETCIEEILTNLAKTDFQVWLRPHPEYMKRRKQKLAAIERIIERTSNAKMQTDMPAMQCLYEADVLITDHSTICFDFALGTERRVLFIDTPNYAGNPEYQKLDMEPLENIYRDKIGVRLDPRNIDTIGSKLDSIIAEEETFRASIPAMRDRLIANWQRAAVVGGQYIIDAAAS